MWLITTAISLQHCSPLYVTATTRARVLVSVLPSVSGESLSQGLGQKPCCWGEALGSSC